MDKESLERDYRQWVREYKCAHNENERWGARKSMARIERIAAEDYGFKFADQLHKLLDEQPGQEQRGGRWEKREVWIVRIDQYYDSEHYDDYDSEDPDAGAYIGSEERCFLSREEALKAVSELLDEGEQAELQPAPEIREVLVTSPVDPASRSVARRLRVPKL